MRKILSIILSLVMVLSMVGTLALVPAVASAADRTTIDDMPASNGTSIVNLDDQDYATLYGQPYLWGANSGGFYSVNALSGTQSYTDGVYTAKLHIIDEPTTANPSNKALQFEGDTCIRPVTEAEHAEMTLDVVLNGSTIKAKLGELYDSRNPSTTTPCYIYGDVGKTKYWLNKTDSYTLEELQAGNKGTATAPSNNFWFTKDGKASTNASATSVTLPKIKTAQVDENGYTIGTYSVGFKFKYPDITNTKAPLQLYIESGSSKYTFYLWKDNVGSYFDSNARYNQTLWVSDEETMGITANIKGQKVGKTKDVAGIYAKSDMLDTLPEIADNEWNDFLMTCNLEEETYRIYLNGKAVFFNVGGVYSSENYMPRAKALPSVSLTHVRHQTNAANPTIVDDCIVKYDTETLSSKLKWDMISNGQGIASVVSDLNLINTSHLVAHSKP